MRILHIVDILHVDGRTTLLRDLVRSGQLGTQQMILSLFVPGPMANDFSRLGVPVLALGLRRPFHGLAQKRAALSAVTKFNPDVCLCWSGRANMISIVPWLLRTPVIWTIHNAFEAMNTRARKLGLALLAATSGTVPYRIVCCSQETQRIYRDIHRLDPERLTTITNGVDVSKFTPDPASRAMIRRSLGISDDHIVVATAARMSDPRLSQPR